MTLMFHMFSVNNLTLYCISIVIVKSVNVKWKEKEWRREIDLVPSNAEHCTSLFVCEYILLELISASEFVICNDDSFFLPNFFLLF